MSSGICLSLRNQKEKLDPKLQEICHKGYCEAHKELARDELDVPSLPNIARGHYRTLLDHKRWPAMKDSKDSKALKRGYRSVNMTATGDLSNSAELKNCVYQLVQAAQNGTSQATPAIEFERKDTGIRNALPGRAKMPIPERIVREYCNLPDQCFA